MLLYWVGKIVSIKPKHIVFENNNCGYVLNIANDATFSLSDSKNQKIYIYEYKNEYISKRYAFSTFKERILFEDLLTLSGIGPRTALSLISHGVDKINKMIINANVQSLSQLPYIGLRTAKQIIIEFEDKYKKMFGAEYEIIEQNDSKKTNTNSNYNELKSTLQVLGFKQSQIKYALDQIDNFTLPSEQLVEQSIKLISSGTS